MAGRPEVEVIRFLPAASVKQVGSQLLSVSMPRLTSEYLTDGRLRCGRVLISRWRSQEDEECYEL